ncbi:MAG TPA: Gfo/Idh/MocA family oxidoreductase [Chloroflexia bacterium]|nr:Gfo/Idh/MocA family oxidoreductase [Chloroflexia bacterium]
MPKTIRWGILGAGNIARGIAQGLRLLPEAQLLGVASRNPANAKKFAADFSVPRVYQTYEELVKDAEIDVIYVATPHSRHKEDCILCLENGKAVLCEKPFTINAREAREIVDLARQKGLFCMEAMWMRFIPLVQKVKAMVDSGAIGEVRMLSADFGVPTHFDPHNRFFDPGQGGGALLDRGVYAVSLAYLLLGAPGEIVSEATIGTTGVDEQAAILLRYPKGQLATLTASLRTYSSNEAVIMGSKGKIRLHEPFYCPQKASSSAFVEPGPPTPAGSPGLKDKVRTQLKENPVLRPVYKGLKEYVLPVVRHPDTIVDHFEGNGYNYELAEVVRCLQTGQLESKVMPLDETVKIMEIMDQVRQQWGLKYPQE